MEEQSRLAMICELLGINNRYSQDLIYVDSIGPKCQNCNRNTVNFAKLECGHECCTTCLDQLYDEYQTNFCPKIESESNNCCILFECPWCSARIKDFDWIQK